MAVLRLHRHPLDVRRRSTSSSARTRTRGRPRSGWRTAGPWVAYLNQGTLFVKRFDYREGAVYPDRGTSYQTFSNEDMLEMETVGELVTLHPGQSRPSWMESWELFTDVPAGEDRGGRGTGHRAASGALTVSRDATAGARHTGRHGALGQVRRGVPHDALRCRVAANGLSPRHVNPHVVRV